MRVTLLIDPCTLLEPNIGVGGASAAGASEIFVYFANTRQCVHQKLGRHDRGQGKN